MCIRDRSYHPGSQHRATQVAEVSLWMWCPQTQAQQLAMPTMGRQSSMQAREEPPWHTRWIGSKRRTQQCCA
eukprot:4697644-Alexandrium_andersonii.AAC.1